MQSITIKTVGNARFTAEVKPETTVEELTAIITQDAPADFLKGGVIKKFILRGKTLKPAQTVASLGLTGEDEIVCLAKRNRGRKSKSATPEPKKTTQSADDQKEDDTGLPTYQIKGEDVEKLMKMGFPYQMVFVSLRAAKGDPKLACQYLIAGGIPAAAAARLHKEEEALRQKMVKEGTIPEDFKPNSMTTPAPQQQAPQPAQAVGPNGLNARFEALLSNKDALTEVMGNSQVQQECMQMLGVENPELFKRFMENPDEVGASDEFAKAMFQIMHKAMGAKQKRRVIKLTEEDRENLKKLQEQCHVDRRQAATVYLGNGKDFDRSKAYLDDLLARANAVASAAAGPASPRAAASAREPLSLLGDAAQEKMVEPEPEEQQENDESTTLTISPDMLLDDE